MRWPDNYSTSWPVTTGAGGEAGLRKRCKIFTLMEEAFSSLFGYIQGADPVIGQRSEKGSQGNKVAPRASSPATTTTPLAPVPC